MFGIATFVVVIGIGFAAPRAAALPLSALCGDGICLSPVEDATRCPADCVVCGDGRCDGPEDPVSCAPDCGCEAARACGGHADGGCFCDAECVEFGDCCPDACERCEVCPGGACGSAACQPGGNAFEGPPDSDP